MVDNERWRECLDTALHELGGDRKKFRDDPAYHAQVYTRAYELAYPPGERDEHAWIEMATRLFMQNYGPALKELEDA